MIVLLFKFFFYSYLLIIMQPEIADGSYQQSVELDISVQEKVENLISLSQQHANSDAALSFEYAQRAVLEAEGSDDIDLQYRSFTNLGYVAFNAGLFEVAIENYFRVLPIAEDMNDLKKISVANYMVGAIRLVLEDYEAAEKYLQLGMQQMEEATLDGESISSNTRLIFANNMGVVYLGLQRLPEAEEAILNGLQMSDELNVQSTKVRIQLLHNLADAYHRQGKYTEAVEILEQADELIADEEGVELLESMVYLLWGKIMQDTDEVERALPYYQSAYHLAKNADGASHIKHASARLSDYYKAVNQPDSALIYANISELYESKQRLRQAGEELARIELLSQFRQTEAQLSREYQQSVRFYLILALGFLAISIVVYVLYVKAKKRFWHTDREKKVLSKQFEMVQEERDKIKEKVVAKEKEETLQTLQVLQSKQKVGEMIQMITKNGKSSDQMLSALKESLSELNNLDKDQMWTEFDLRFKGVHGEFNERLNQSYPMLTANERRLCAFIKMDMTTKEIVAVTGQSIRAVEMARTRLRKKLELTGTGVNLNQHIQQI